MSALIGYAREMAANRTAQVIAAVALVGVLLLATAPPVFAALGGLAVLGAVVAIVVAIVRAVTR